jgi:hypothetical protein
MTKKIPQPLSVFSLLIFSAPPSDFINFWSNSLPNVMNIIKVMAHIRIKIYEILETFHSFLFPFSLRYYGF